MTSYCSNNDNISQDLLLQNGSNNDYPNISQDLLLSIVGDIVQGMRFLHAATPPVIHAGYIILYYIILHNNNHNNNT